MLYGTFLTRSGVLADFSVHSFVDLGISGWLIGLMAFFAGSSASGCSPPACASVPTAPNEDPLLSRGTFLVLVDDHRARLRRWSITVGTSAPLLTRFLEDPGQVGPEFYNRVNLPIALLVALPARAGAVPHLAGRTPPRELLRRLIAPGVAVALAPSAAALALGVREPLHLLFVFLAALALATNLAEDGRARSRGAAACAAAAATWRTSASA